tara:strand:- start:103 stop:357 length:255 start_codon:yes stop_codon:yes gene_type:complete
MGASPFLFHMGVELGGRRARQAPLMVPVAPVFMTPVAAIALQTPALRQWQQWNIRLQKAFFPQRRHSRAGALSRLNGAGAVRGA